MDLNDLWQEHKRFILAVAIGATAFLVGYGVVSSRFHTSGLERAIAKARSTLAQDNRYDAAALRALQAWNQELQARKARLAGLVEFQVRPRFKVDGEANPDLRYINVAANTRDELVELCERENILVDPARSAGQMGLPRVSPQDREEIQRTLRGLDLVDRTLRAWVEAGRKARAEDRRAQGVISLDEIAIEAGAPRARAAQREPAGPRLDLVGARFRLRCDSRTVEHFLILSQQGSAPLQVEEFAASLSPRGAAGLDVVLKLAAAQLLGGE